MFFTTPLQIECPFTNILSDDIWYCYVGSATCHDCEHNKVYTKKYVICELQLKSIEERKKKMNKIIIK